MPTRQEGGGASVNIMGMGFMELMLVLLIAVIFLGPERLVDGARTLGRAMREVRRMSSALSVAALDEDEPAPPAQKQAGAAGAGAGRASAPEADGPVTFRPSQAPSLRPGQGPADDKTGE